NKINDFFRKKHIGPELRIAYHNRLRGTRDGLSVLPKEMLLMILEFAFPPLDSFEKMIRDVMQNNTPIRANSMYGGWNQEDATIFGPGIYQPYFKEGMIKSHQSGTGKLYYNFEFDNIPEVSITDRECTFNNAPDTEI